MSANPYIGDDFDEYLEGRGISSERVQALTAKFVIAARFHEEMSRQCVTKTELARRMGTSRAVVHRLLDEQDTSLTLATLVSACTALGMQLDFGAMMLAADAPKAQDDAPAPSKAPARRAARTRRAAVPA